MLLYGWDKIGMKHYHLLACRGLFLLWCLWLIDGGVELIDWSQKTLFTLFDSSVAIFLFFMVFAYFNGACFWGIRILNKNFTIFVKIKLTVIMLESSTLSSIFFSHFYNNLHIYLRTFSSLSYILLIYMFVQYKKVKYFFCSFNFVVSTLTNQWLGWHWKSKPLVWKKNVITIG